MMIFDRTRDGGEAGRREQAADPKAGVYVRARRPPAMTGPLALWMTATPHGSPLAEGISGLARNFE
jgi:hypothetical protein